MKIKSAYTALLSTILLIFSFFKISVELNDIFANDFQIRHSSVLISLSIYSIIFISVLSFLFQQTKNHVLSRSNVLMSLLLFVIFNLVMLIPVCLHILSVPVFNIESSGIYGYGIEGNHMIKLTFLQALIFMSLLFYLKSLFKKEYFNE